VAIGRASIFRDARSYSCFIRYKAVANSERLAMSCSSSETTLLSFALLSVFFPFLFPPVPSDRPRSCGTSIVICVIRVL